MIEYEFTPKPPRIHKVGEAESLPSRSMFPERAKNLWLFMALQSKAHVYEGTVPRNVKRRRRVQNRNARLARRRNRK